MKYDFNMTYTGDVFVDGLVYANTQVSGLLVYFIVFMFGLVLLYVYNNKLDDFSLSFLYSLYAVDIFGILFYYFGLFIGVELFSGFLLIGLLLLTSGLSGLLYYSRNKIGGD